MDSNIISNLFSEDNSFLVPDYLSEKKDYYISEWEKTGLRNHVFIFSSGTTSKKFLKSFAISKEALFENAKAVNDFLKTNVSDKWLLSLPYYHVGGLSILFRSFLGKYDYVEKKYGKWDPKLFHEQLVSDQITYASLIPRQLYDLIQLNLICPKSLKGLFIGGDFLSSDLAKSAQNLGYPIIVTYGMTELSSQIASSYFKDMEDRFIKILPIHKLEETYINSKALFSANIIFENEIVKINMQDKNFKLPDEYLLKFEGEHKFIKVLGRKDNQIKLKGRLVDSVLLKDTIYNLMIKNDIYNHCELFISKNEKLETFLIIEHEEDIRDNLIKFKEDLYAELPYLNQMIEFREIKYLERTSIGKIKRNSL